MLTCPNLLLNEVVHLRLISVYLITIWNPFYSDIIMNVTPSHIIGVSIICSAVCSGADQRKYQSSASLAFVRGIHWSPVDSPRKGPLARKMLPFDDVPMYYLTKYDISLLMMGYIYFIRHNINRGKKNKLNIHLDTWDTGLNLGLSLANERRR